MQYTDIELLQAKINRLEAFIVAIYDRRTEAANFYYDIVKELQITNTESSVMNIEDRILQLRKYVPPFGEESVGN